MVIAVGDREVCCVTLWRLSFRSWWSREGLSALSICSRHALTAVDFARLLTSGSGGDCT